MSYLTDVILITGIDDGEIDALNNYLFKEYKDYLFQAGPTTPGKRNLTNNIFMGCFNYFHITSFVEIIKEQIWKDPDWIQLLVQTEDDDKFEIINIQEWGDDE